MVSPITVVPHCGLHVSLGIFGGVSGDSGEDFAGTKQNLHPNLRKPPQKPLKIATGKATPPIN